LVERIKDGRKVLVRSVWALLDSLGELFDHHIDLAGGPYGAGGSIVSHLCGQILQHNGIDDFAILLR
jgi:hypothetical protein